MDEPLFAATPSERVQAARARAEDIIRKQGIKPFDWDEVMALTSPSEETDEEFDAFLRELRGWRREGAEEHERKFDNFCRDDP